MKVSAFLKERILWIFMLLGVTLTFIIGKRNFNTLSDIFSVDGFCACLIFGYFSIALFLLSECLLYYFEINETGIKFLKQKKDLWHIRWEEIAEIGFYPAQSWLRNEGIRDYSLNYGETIYISKIPLPKEEISIILQFALICCLEAEGMVGTKSSAQTERFYFFSGIIMKELAKGEKSKIPFIVEMFQRPENQIILQELENYYFSGKLREKHLKKFYRELRRTEPLQNITFITSQGRISYLIRKYCPTKLVRKKSCYDILSDLPKSGIILRDSFKLKNIERYIVICIAVYSFILLVNEKFLAAPIALLSIFLTLRIFSIYNLKYKFNLRGFVVSPGKRCLLVWEAIREIGIFHDLEESFIYLSTINLTDEQRQNPKLISGVTTIRYSDEVLKTIKKYYSGKIYFP